MCFHGLFAHFLKIKELGDEENLEEKENFQHQKNRYGSLRSWEIIQ
jgi:hypothetical protein